MKLYIVRWGGGPDESDEARFEDEPDPGEDDLSVILERLGAEMTGVSHKGNEKWLFRAKGSRRAR